VLLLPLPLNILVKAMIALVVSAVASYFLLADWRNQMGEQLAGAASRRTAEKQRLRAALAGDEDAAAAGDRAAAPTDRTVAAGDRADAPAKRAAAPAKRAAAPTDRAATPTEAGATADADVVADADAEADSETHRAR